MVLVSRSSRLPIIQHLLKDYIDEKKLYPSINLDDDTNCGATVLDTILIGNGDENVQELLVVDVTLLELDLETIGRMIIVLISRSATISAKEEQIFPTYSDHQLENAPIEELIRLNYCEPTGTKYGWTGCRNRRFDWLTVKELDSEAERKSEGAPTSEVRRIRRRSISITPEIGDDIARAVRAMTEALKQNRLLKEQGENSSYHHTSNKKDGASDLKKDYNEEISSIFQCLRFVVENEGKRNSECIPVDHSVLSKDLFSNSLSWSLRMLEMK
ncbi:hypothetical protein FXO38_04489 [Capsicum annuum]|nr:hypothetical protein FXO37_23371 [Capsicum annuum]KAF3676061.1 hypothetical protein FXO38_04489 [Capsicum annuum]